MINTQENHTLPSPSLPRALVTATAAAVTLATAYGQTFDFTDDFAPSNWTSTLAGGSSLSHSSKTLTLVGPNTGVATTRSLTASVSVGLLESGNVQFNYWGSTADTDGWGSPTALNDAVGIGYELNGNLIQLSPNSRFSTVTGLINLSLNAGDTLQFWASSRDSTEGAATLTISNFSFTPVPEPSEYAAIAAAGLVGFGLWRRFQRCA